MQNGYHSSSVQRALAILEFLGSSQRLWNISELSRRLHIPKSSTHVLMTTLEGLGYIIKEGGRRDYTAAVRFYGLAATGPRRLSLPEGALRQIEQLVRETGLTAHLAVLDDGQALYVQKVVPPGAIELATEIGKRVNLHCTAVGKVLLAYTTGPKQETLLSRARLTRHTENTIPSGSELRIELDKVRRFGFAFDDQEEELDTRCVAVPVRDSFERLVASLGVAGAVNQIHHGNMKALLTALRHAARLIPSRGASIPDSKSA
jgi:DNA-binding IclR family transcriptional regulator